MDLKNVKPSTRFEDHTSYTPVQKMVDKVAIAFNPVFAARKLRDVALENGLINPPEIIPIRRGLPKVGGK